MRVYIPSTLDRLAAYLAAGRIADGERLIAPEEDEESEYAALEAAADSSAVLLDGPGRRVVVVAEVADPDAVISISLVDAVHADTDDVDPADRHLPDLAWFATQEIPDLLG